MKGKMAAGALVLTAGLGFAAAACTTVTNQPSSPTSTITRPAPASTNVQPPASTPAASYAQDITNAGIVAPVDWINRMGEQLCADWRNGMTTADTNPVLLAGGLHADHLDAFNRITNTDLCPDVTPLRLCAGGTYCERRGIAPAARVSVPGLLQVTTSRWACPESLEEPGGARRSLAGHHLMAQRAGLDRSCAARRRWRLLTTGRAGG